MNSKTIFGIIVLAVFCLSVSIPIISEIAEGQTFIPGQKEEAKITRQVTLENKEIGSVERGTVLIFDTQATVNGVYNSVEQIYKEARHDVDMAGTSIDTKDLKEGYYVAYGSGKYAIFRVIPPVPEDAFINLVEIDRVSTYGDMVNITGETNLQDNLTAVIRDDRGREYGLTNIVVSDGKFDININTKNLQPGNYSVLIYYGDDKNIQAVAPVFLAEPHLSLNASARTTVHGDINITGTADGTKKVEVWLVGNGLAGYTQLNIMSEDGTFNSTVKPLNFTFYDRNGMISPIDRLQRGMYDVLIVHPGADGFYHYGSIEETGKLLSYPDGISRFMNNQTSSSNYDIVNRVKVSVDLPTITISDVTLSADGKLMIMGSTNIPDGQKRLIVTVDGTQYFTDIQNGRFVLMMDGAREGEYRIEVSDIENTAYASGSYNVSIEKPKVNETPMVTQPVEEPERGASGGFNMLWLLLPVIIIVILIAVYLFFFKKQ
jgi:hypothetical protein